MIRLFKIVIGSLISMFHNPLEPNDKNRFDFLDGYRGILALIVVITHCQKHAGCELMNFFVGISRTVAVDGFFILSSFLLTYRLLGELNKSNGNYRKQILIVLKYFIRRFLEFTWFLCSMLLLSNSVLNS